MQAKKAAATTPSPIPNIKLRQHQSLEQEDITNEDSCEYSHTSPSTTTEFHHVGPIDAILAATGRYVAKAVANGTCFSTSIMIAWRNRPLEHPNKFTSAELDEIRAVDKARMEAWEQTVTWKDLYKNAPFVPKDSSPEKNFKLTKAFFKAIIKPLATAGRKPQHYGSEADIYTASLALGTPIYLFERHTTTTQPTQEYWTLSEYTCDAEAKTCYVLNRNKWHAILASNTNHVIRYVNNNHYDAIPQTEEYSQHDNEELRAAFLEKQKDTKQQITQEIVSQTQAIIPKLAQASMTKPARQSSIQSFFATVPAKNPQEVRRPDEDRASEDMDCSTLEEERTRKRAQRDQQDSADDKQEKISKGPGATNVSSNRPILLRLTNEPANTQGLEITPMENIPRAEDRWAMRDETQDNPWATGSLENSTRPSRLHTEPGDSSLEEVPTQYTDTLTWDNEDFHSDWPEAKRIMRQLQFEAVSEATIKARQDALDCTRQEAVNDIYLAIHNEVMLDNGSALTSTPQSQLEDSDYTPQSTEDYQSSTQSSNNTRLDSKDPETDREAHLLADIKRFRQGRQGLTKDLPENEAQVNAWCKRNLKHLKDLFRFTEGTGTLLNLMTPDTIEEYGQLLIVNATVTWLASVPKTHQDGRLEAWYTELANEGINIKMRHARATSKTNWTGYTWESNQEMVNAWIRIQPRQRVNMAILTTLSAIMELGKDNMITWITKHARNHTLKTLW